MTTLIRLLSIVPGLLVCEIARAHPGTHYDGAFLTGLAHPFLGMDHLLAMVCVGLWAVQLGGRYRLICRNRSRGAVACFIDVEFADHRRTSLEPVMSIGKTLLSILSALGRSRTRASLGEERLWKVWWLAGIPVGWTTSVLLLVAEHLRYSGKPGWGDALDVSRFLIYVAWFQLAWRCSRNVERAAWTPLARGALAAGLVLSAAF